MRRLPVALVFAAVQASAEPSSTTVEQAYDMGEIPNPRQVALGGAVHATGTSTTALFANPANLALARVYHFEGIAGLSPESGRKTLGGAVADSTNKFAGGVGGTWSSFDGDGLQRTWLDFRLAGAYPLGDRVSIGLGARYLRVTQLVGRGPLGPSLASDGTPDDPLVHTLTLDAGLTVNIVEGLRAAVSAHNLTNPGHGYAPLNMVGAVGYASDMFSVEGDFQLDFTTYASTKMRIMFGGEILLAEHFPIRAGYRYDQGTNVHSGSLGVGYVDKRWSLDFGIRRDLSADHPSTMMMLGVRYFYDAGSVDGPDTM